MNILRSFFFIISILFASCIHNKQEMQTGIVVKTIETEEQLDIIEDTEEYHTEEVKWTIKVNFKNKDFAFLVYDIISQTISEKSVQKGLHEIVVSVKATDEEFFMDELHLRLNRYTKIEREKKTITINELENNYIRMPRYHAYYNFIKVLDKSFIDKVLSISRRSKYYIISEWEKEDGFYLAIWTSASSQELAKNLQKQIPELDITYNDYVIKLEKRGTIVEIVSDSQNLRQEIKMALSTRFNDLGIEYIENNNGMIIWSNEDTSITEIIKKIFKEDEILPLIEVSLDKTTKSIRIKEREP